MKSYYKIIPGRGSQYFNDFKDNSYIGAGWLSEIDLNNEKTENYREFNKKFIPIYMEKEGIKSRVSAGLACGMLWTIAFGIKIGDIILMPDGQGKYLLGEVISDYFYQKDAPYPHRRKVKWLNIYLYRDELSESFQNSLRSIGTVSNVTPHAEEIEKFLNTNKNIAVVSDDQSVENAQEFVFEKHLEDFLVQNWDTLPLSKEFQIYRDEESGEIIGRQYQTDTGYIDLLAISNDGKTLLVVELKKGRASDVVVGQIQRYMGYVKSELATEGQDVKGIIIAFDKDLKLMRALSVVNNIDFYTYSVNFTLNKESGL